MGEHCRVWQLWGPAAVEDEFSCSFHHTSGCNGFFLLWCPVHWWVPGTLLMYNKTHKTMKTLNNPDVFEFPDVTVCTVQLADLGKRHLLMFIQN